MSRTWVADSENVATTELLVPKSMPTDVMLAPSVETMKTGSRLWTNSEEVSMNKLMHAAAEHVGPVFIRAGRAKVPVIYGADQEFTIGKAVPLRTSNER